MTDNSPRAVYLRMLAAYNDGSPESYGSDRFLEHFADDATIEIPAAPPAPARRGGKDTFREAMVSFGGGLRDRRAVSLELVVEGDRVVSRNHWTARTADDSLGVPAGTTMHIDYVDFCGVRNGLIVDYTSVSGPLAPES